MALTKSPTKAKKKMMTLPKALEHVIAGKKITKLEWKNKHTYIALSEEKLLFLYIDGKKHQWTINDGDLLGEDWVVL